MSLSCQNKRQRDDLFRDDKLKRIKLEISKRDELTQLGEHDHDEFWKFFDEPDGGDQETIFIEEGIIRRKMRLKWALQSLLLPPLSVVWNHIPQSAVFKRPVNPEMDTAPDYFNIIKNPMDLGTVREKLLGGGYRDPWPFIADVLLVFNNAKIYNRRPTWIYKAAVVLEAVFIEEMDRIMPANGYCCGTRFFFKVYNIPCRGKEGCTIGKNQKYFQFRNLYSYCVDCFKKDELPIIFPYDAVGSGTDTKAVRKHDFKEMINNKEVEEPLVSCNSCGIRSHAVCALYIPIPYESGFVCDSCREVTNGNPKKASEEFRAEMLKSTEMSGFVESRVNKFLEAKETPLEGGPVVIRIVSCCERDVEVMPLMKKLYEAVGQHNIRFPCRMKVLLAFQRIDGKDVCFFGMITQEYGSTCPAPNTRRVYIAFLDSVHFFRPHKFRTAVYHEIILGYLAFMKNLGFSVAHLWACPPADGNEYIFHGHPPEQKVPKLRRLQEWYKKMLDVGKVRGIVHDWKDILRIAEQEKIMSLTEIPYFEGDFWPNTLEGFIVSYEKEKAEQATVDEQPSIKKKKPLKKMPRFKGPVYGDELTNKLYSTMNTHKGLFFVVKLHSPEDACNLGPILDPDPLIPCESFEARDTFLAYCKERRLEFSSLRRAKYATLGVLMELLKDNFHCDLCKVYLEERYHCPVCDDLDLCPGCYSTANHEHDMERLGFTEGAEAEGSDNSAREDTKMERTRKAMREILVTLKHVGVCQNQNGPCDLPRCAKIKIMIDHILKCPLKATLECGFCLPFLQFMLTHVRTCVKLRKKICPVPLCTNLKHSLIKIKRFADENDERDSRRRIVSTTSFANWLSRSCPDSSRPTTRVSPQQHSPPRLSLEHSEEDEDVVEVSHRPWENMSEVLEVPFPVLPPTADSLLAKAPVESVMDTVLSPYREEERILIPSPTLSEPISVVTVSENDSQTYCVEIPSQAGDTDAEDEVQIVGEVGGYHQQHQELPRGATEYVILNPGDNFLDHGGLGVGVQFYQYIQIE